MLVGFRQTKPGKVDGIGVGCPCCRIIATEARFRVGRWQAPSELPLGGGGRGGLSDYSSKGLLFAGTLQQAGEGEEGLWDRAKVFQNLLTCAFSIR